MLNLETLDPLEVSLCWTFCYYPILYHHVCLIRSSRGRHLSIETEKKILGPITCLFGNHKYCCAFVAVPSIAVACTMSSLEQPLGLEKLPSLSTIERLNSFRSTSCSPRGVDGGMGECWIEGRSSGSSNSCR